MKYAEVIHNAWSLTLESSKLKWFAFVPSVIAVIVFILEVAWQLFWYSKEFEFLDLGISFKNVKHFFSFLVENGFLIWVIFLVIFIIIFAFVLPALIKATILLTIRHKFENPNEPIKIRKKVVEGLNYFFYLFEYKGMMAPFQFFTIAFFVATMYRFYHGTIFDHLWPVVIVYFVFSIFVNIFLAFAPYFIVFENQNLGSAIKSSMSLVFLNFGKTLALILLMFLVNFRVLINVLVVLGVPFGILLTVSYFAASGWFGFALFVIIILGILAILFASYLTAILEIFLTAVWERTFDSLIKESKA